MSAAEKNWQPIETAPTDERIVMAYFGPEKRWHGFATVARFFRWECMPERMADGAWPSDEEPTHWMPLPSPPESP